MTEVVILVISTSLLIVWLFSLKAKAAQMRSQPILAGNPEQSEEITEPERRAR